MWLLFFFEFKAIIWVRTSPHIFVILHSPSYFMHTNNYKWPTKHSWQYWIIVHSLLVLCRVITFSPLVGGPSIREFQVRLFFFFFFSDTLMNTSLAIIICKWRNALKLSFLAISVVFGYILLPTQLALFVKFAGYSHTSHVYFQVWGSNLSLSTVLAMVWLLS